MEWCNILTGKRTGDAWRLSWGWPLLQQECRRRGGWPPTRTRRRKFSVFWSFLRKQRCTTGTVSCISCVKNRLVLPPDTSSHASLWNEWNLRFNFYQPPETGRHTDRQERVVEDTCFKRTLTVMNLMNLQRPFFKRASSWSGGRMERQHHEFKGRHCKKCCGLICGSCSLDSYYAVEECCWCERCFRCVWKNWFNLLWICEVNRVETRNAAVDLSSHSLLVVFRNLSSALRGEVTDFHLICTCHLAMSTFVTLRSTGGKGLHKLQHRNCIILMSLAQFSIMLEIIYININTTL